VFLLSAPVLPDYRNGIRTFDYDPTKWLISTLHYFGLTYNLKTFPSNEIKKGVVLMKEKKLSELKATVSYPPPIESLPKMTWKQIHYAVAEGKAMIVINGLVHDVTEFVPQHVSADLD
jgi:stearoyl-CoA desaturase (delta-9 desaturase)